MHDSDWDPQFVAAIQTIMDRSAVTASPIAAKNVNDPRFVLSALDFLESWGRWEALPVCMMATTGPAGQPHVAAVHCGFDGQVLTVRIFEGSVRQRNLSANPRVALMRSLPDNTVMTIYGIARRLPNRRERDLDPLGDGSYTHRYDIEIRRIYAIRPTPVGRE